MGSINNLVHLDLDSQPYSEPTLWTLNLPTARHIQYGTFVLWKVEFPCWRDTRCKMESTSSTKGRSTTIEATEIHIHAADCAKTDWTSAKSSTIVCSAYPCPSSVPPSVDYLVQVMATLPFSMGHVDSLQAESGIFAERGP